MNDWLWNTGNTDGGFAKIKQHPFFEDIDFDLLLTRNVTPPYVPESNVGSGSLGDFSMAMKKMNKDELLSLPSISNEENVYFKHFDYINPTVLKTEFGIANEFKQYSRCAKVKRLLGGDGGDGGGWNDAMILY